MCDQHARKQGGEQEGRAAVTDVAEGNAAIHPTDDMIRFNQRGTLIPAISARILKASSESLDEVIQTSPREGICSLGLERGGLFEVLREKGTVFLSHVWFDRGAGSHLLARGVNLAEHHPWTYRQMAVLGKTATKTTFTPLPRKRRQTTKPISVSAPNHRWPFLCSSALKSFISLPFIPSRKRIAGRSPFIGISACLRQGVLARTAGEHVRSGRQRVALYTGERERVFHCRIVDRTAGMLTYSSICRYI